MLFSQTEEESQKEVIVAAVVTMGDSHHRSGGHLDHCIHSTAAFSDGFHGTFLGLSGFKWPSPLRYGEGSSLKVSVDTSRFAAVNVKIYVFLCLSKTVCDIELS